MALTDSENTPNAKRQDALHSTATISRRTAHIPHEFLARLPVLRAEAGRNVRLGRFVANSVPLAGLLMLAGGMVLLAGGGGLQGDFVWSLLVLGGITAMTVNYIRGPARSPHTTKLETSAADLRAILLYTGFAWGAGAFLALPADPGIAAALAFALGPVVLAVLLLRDEAGIAAFAAPSAGLTAAAGLFLHWTAGRILSPVIVAACIAVIVFACLKSGRVHIPGRSGTA
jgi:hypothetical protein